MALVYESVSAGPAAASRRGRSRLGSKPSQPGAPLVIVLFVTHPGFKLPLYGEDTERGDLAP